MKIVVFTITGWPHGLLMDNPASMAPPEKPGGIKAKVEQLSGREQADSKVYKDANGFLRFPAMAFRSALIAASAGRKFGKIAAGRVIKGSVFPAEEWVQILDAKSGKPRKEYDVVFSCRTVNRTTKGSNITSRPNTKNWSCKLALEVDDELVQDAPLLELLNMAGKTIGIGAYRPFCPVGVGGPYGRFTAVIDRAEEPGRARSGTPPATASRPR